MIYIALTSIVLFYAVYMLLTIGIAWFYTSPDTTLSDSDHDVLVFFPMYKPGADAVMNLNRQKKELEHKNVKVLVLSQEADSAIDAELARIADYHKAESFSHLSGNSYHHALAYAVRHIETLGQSFDSVLLLDPDNFMDQYSLQRLIASRSAGHDVGLSRRKSYAKETSTSLFDGLSERLNDYMLRRSKAVMGFHPELSGSGMLLDTNLFRNAVLKLDKKAPGMDKQLLIHMMLMKDDLQISYDEDAVVLDEKTDQAASFNRQRLRWFGNQYYNAYHYGRKLLTSRDSSLVDYGISLWRPPRSFQIVASVLLTPFDLYAYWMGWIHAPVLAVSAVISVVAISLFLLKEDAFRMVVRQMLPMAGTALRNGWTALHGSGSASGSFIHTRADK
ncbi:MAG: glycosyltransferase [Bacteroidota bacterium]